MPRENQSRVWQLALCSSRADEDSRCAKKTANILRHQKGCHDEDGAGSWAELQDHHRRNASSFLQFVFSCGVLVRFQRPRKQGSLDGDIEHLQFLHAHSVSHTQHSSFPQQHVAAPSHSPLTYLQRKNTTLYKRTRREEILTLCIAEHIFLLVDKT